MRALVIDGPRSARVAEVEVPRPAAGPGRGGRAPGRDLRDRRRAVHRRAGLLRAGEVALPAASRTRVVRRRLRRRRRGRRGLARRPRHRRHHARLRPLPPLPGGKRACLRGPARDRDHRLAGRAGRQGAGPRDQLAPAAGRVDDRAGALVEPGGNARGPRRRRWPDRAARILVCGPGTIGLLAVAFARAAGADVDVLAARPRAAGSSRRRSAPAGTGPRTSRRRARTTRSSTAPAITAFPRPRWRWSSRPGGWSTSASPPAEPDRQPRHRAQRPHRGRDPRSVSGPGDRHRALRGRPGRTGSPGGSRRGPRPGGGRAVGPDRSRARRQGSHRSSPVSGGPLERWRPRGSAALTCDDRHRILDGRCVAFHCGPTPARAALSVNT